MFTADQQTLFPVTVPLAPGTTTLIQVFAQISSTGSTGPPGSWVSTSITLGVYRDLNLSAHLITGLPVNGAAIGLVAPPAPPPSGAPEPSTLHMAGLAALVLVLATLHRPRRLR